MANMHPLQADQVKEILAANKRGEKVPALGSENKEKPKPDYKSAAGEDSITRFDKSGGGKRKRNGRKNRSGNPRNNSNTPNTPNAPKAS